MRGRPRKGLFDDIVVKAVGEKPRSFSEIRDYVSSYTGRKISDKVLWFSLKRLAEKGEIEKEKGKRGRWLLTTGYWRRLAYNIVKEIILAEGEAECRCNGTAPSFSLGTDVFPDKLLNEVAIGRLVFQILTHLSKKSHRERETILSFAARCIWLGFCSTAKLRNQQTLETELQTLIETTVAEEEHYAEILAHYMAAGMELAIKTANEDKAESERGFTAKAKLTLPSHHQKRILSRALVHILIGGVDSPSLALKQWLRLLTSATEKWPNFTVKMIEEVKEKTATLWSQLKPLADEATRTYRRELENQYQWRMWEKGEIVFETLNAVAYKVINDVPKDLELNLKWIQRNLHEFLRFIEWMKSVRFIQMVAFGYPELEYIDRIDLAHHIEEMLEALKAGRIHRISDLKLLGREADKVLSQLKKRREPSKITLQFLMRFLALPKPAVENSLEDISYIYPSIKKIEWWKNLKDLVERQIKKIKNKEYIE